MSLRAEFDDRRLQKVAWAACLTSTTGQVRHAAADVFSGKVVHSFSPPLGTVGQEDHDLAAPLELRKSIQGAFVDALRVKEDPPLLVQRGKHNGGHGGAEIFLRSEEEIGSRVKEMGDSLPGRQ